MKTIRDMSARPLRHDRQRQRSYTRNLLAFLQLIGHVFAPWKRPWRTRWGALPNEPDPSLPGEDLIPEPMWESTHGISINAPAEAVWPWIAQIGQGRGGFYSFERLENMLGCRIINADRILPEHQELAVGDEIRLAAGTAGLRVAAVEVGRSIVLQGSPVEVADHEAGTLWAFHLIPDGPGWCRLVERSKARYGTSITDRLFFSPLLVEPIGFVMSREMLLGIKERAERSVQPTDR